MSIAVFQTKEIFKINYEAFWTYEGVFGGLYVSEI
jgi:hypothetical protein